MTKQEPVKTFWVCACRPEAGSHIKQPWQQSCQECGKSQMDLKEIVVPSGLGGVFAVEIQHIDRDQARVKVINNSNGFGALPPFQVSLTAIQPRWNKTDARSL